MVNVPEVLAPFLVQRRSVVFGDGYLRLLVLSQLRLTLLFELLLPHLDHLLFFHAIVMLFNLSVSIVKRLFVVEKLFVKSYFLVHIAEF